MASVPKLMKSPASQEVYARLIGTLKELGPFTLEEKKTCLHLVRGRAFAGIHPRSTGLLLNLVLDQPLKNKRVRKCEQLSAHRYHVEFLLEEPDQVDAQILGWARQAYAIKA